MSAADKVSYVYTMNGTHVITRVAVVALGIINGCYVINQSDCSVGAGFYAFSAGYATVFADLANVSTLIVVVTFHDNG
jgi:hypothetical protein